MDKKYALLLFFLITQLNRPLQVNAQDITEEQSNLLRTSFSSDFDFTDNTSTNETILADVGDCCCACGCDYCLCECQCECVAHCDAGSHDKPKYRFYEFVKEAYKLLIKRDTKDGNYKNNFEFNARKLKTQYVGIQYDVYTPIFNYYDSTNFTYHHITNPMKFEGNFAAVSTPVTTATYDDVFNTFTFYTSKYTETVTLNIIGDPSSVIETVTLERHLNADGSQDTSNYGLIISDYDDKIIPAPASATPAPDSSYVEIVDADSNPATDSNIVKWTFRFKIRSYGLFEQPDPDSTYQLGKIKIVDARDFNDSSFDNNINTLNSLPQKIIPAGLPADIAEIPPASVTFKVRQPKLNNFKIVKVHDIYWKNSVPPEGIGVDSMPFKINSDKRYISLGYLLSFSIDSTDFGEQVGAQLHGSQFQKLKVVAKFYHGDDEVKLYYDIPNKNLYNQPLPAECRLDADTAGIEVNKGDNQKYGNTGVAKKVVTRDPSESTIDYEDVKTWSFAYYLPPTTKAYLTTDIDPLNNKPYPGKTPLTGLLQVKFYITGDIDGTTTLTGSKTYDFTGKPQYRGGLTDGGDVSGVFYYNLDWNSLDDYSTQKKQ